jgi:outer membrane cobalamin receptor
VKPPQDAKPESWHRFFGSVANNRAWEIAELPAGQVDRLELLNAAHAAAWHWQAIGTTLNRMRALMLLAQAHAQAGIGATALDYAEEMRSYFLATPGTPDWEVAFAHVVHAHAAFAAGASSKHGQSYAEAVRAVAAISDEEDKAIVERVFRRVPAP